jgi:GNAT superfamily N-acetyltransferase
MKEELLERAYEFLEDVSRRSRIDSSSLPPTFKVTTQPEEIRRLADKAFSNRLFVSGWLMRSYLFDSENVTCMVLAEVKGIPIGVGICVQYQDITKRATLMGKLKYLIDKLRRKKDFVGMFFVRDKYRRQGIGTQIYKKLKQNIPRGQSFETWPGTRGSDKFVDYAKNEDLLERAYEFLNS